MTKTLKITGLLATMFLLAFVLYEVTGIAYASLTTRVSINNARELTTYVFFTATTTSATSTNLSDGGGFYQIAGAKKVTMYFTHGGTATTSTAGAKFSVQTTRDGTTWADFNKLIGADLSSTATSTYTIQGATSTVPVALDLSDDTFYGIRCLSAELAGAAATDGEQTCVAQGEF